MDEPSTMLTYLLTYCPSCHRQLGQHFSLVAVSVTKLFLQDRVVSPMLNLQSGFGSNLVWPLSFDLSGLGGPTRSIAPAGIALRVIETRKPTHQRQGNDP